MSIFKTFLLRWLAEMKDPIQYSDQKAHNENTTLHTKGMATAPPDSSVGQKIVYQGVDTKYKGTADCP